MFTGKREAQTGRSELPPTYSERARLGAARTPAWLAWSNAQTRFLWPSPGIDGLRARGWTLKLIERFLGDEDCSDSVSHWANFSSKKLYLVARVESTEAMPEFGPSFC
jgi:hypothetical protein